MHASLGAGEAIAQRAQAGVVPAISADLQPFFINASRHWFETEPANRAIDFIAAKALRNNPGPLVPGV